MQVKKKNKKYYYDGHEFDSYLAVKTCMRYYIAKHIIKPMLKYNRELIDKDQVEEIEGLIKSIEGNSNKMKND